MSTPPMYQANRPASDRQGDASPAPHGPVTGPLDVDALRHPTEGSRFALACVASTAVISAAVFVLVSTGHLFQAVLAVLALVVIILMVLVTSMLLRIQLLANAVQVSAATLPDVDDVVREVRDRLAYDRRLDVFVVNKTSRSLGEGSPPITAISFFGVRFLLIEGDVIGDLSDERQRGQFVFLLATFIGALKARHTTWSPFLSLLQGLVLPKLVGPFVAPWYRATVYTGDRIAVACCGDLDVSLHAFYRDLVGKDIAPHLRAGGFVAQSLRARRRTVLRISQLLHSTPHATNRYLELLSFAGHRELDGFEAFRAEVEPSTRELDGVLGKLDARRPSGAAPAVGILLSVLLLVLGMLTGAFVQHSGAAQFTYDLFSQNSGNEPVPPASEPTEPPISPSPLEPTLDVTAAFIARLPADLRATCVAGTATSEDQAVLVVDCAPVASATPSAVSYYVYSSKAAMRAAFQTYVGEMASGDCETGSNHQTTWTSNDVAQGPLACYTARSGKATVLWGTDNAAVLTIAQDQALEIGDLYAWWTKHAAVS
ncbi:MAG TPA: hypothetical protein VIH10_10970 [Kribbella sp.]